MLASWHLLIIIFEYLVNIKVSKPPKPSKRLAKLKVKKYLEKPVKMRKLLNFLLTVQTNKK